MAQYARYECTEDGHAKFWQITSVSATEVKAEWGRIGKEPQASKVYTTEEIAKIVPEKFKKGYKLVESR